MEIPSPSQMLEYLEAFEKSISRHNEIDQVLRVKLLQASRRLFTSLETPFEMTARILSEQPVEQLVVHLGIDLKIYEILARSETPLSVQDLAKATKANPELLNRIVRAQAAFGSIEDVGGGRYTISPSASFLAGPAFAACFPICQDWLNTSYQALPSKLAKEGYKLPQDDPLDTATTFAVNEQGKNLIQILTERPDKAAAFSQLMNTWGQHGSLLHDVYPVERLAEGYDSSISDVMLVDVGGGWGQKSVAVKKAHPELPGRFITQDLPHVVANAPKTDLCEITAHDFFTPQPVHGPRAFYIRQTLHNWPDADCVKILSNLRDAMEPGYTNILIHELIVPEQNASTWAIAQDFNMMMQLATGERTLEQWTDIVNRAGLHVSKVYHAKDNVSESVIEIEKRMNVAD